MAFFVLSGFVIYWSAVKDEIIEPLRRYCLKRFLRIYPVWLLAIAGLFVILSLETGNIALQPFGRLVGNALMLQDMPVGKPAVICDPLYGDLPLWSLHYEWWFYMLFPAVMLIKGASRRFHIVGTIAVANAVLYAVIPNPICRLLIYFQVWWVGAHAAHCLQTNGRVKLVDLAWPLAYLLVASIPLLLKMTLLWRTVGIPGLGFYPVIELRHLCSAAVLVTTAFAWRYFRWAGFSQTIGVFSALAPISFSLYIIHYRSIASASYLRFLDNSYVELVLYLILTLSFCYVAELVFYPAIRKRFLSKDTASIHSVSEH